MERVRDIEAEAPSEDPLCTALAQAGIALSDLSDALNDHGRGPPVARFAYAGRRYIVYAEAMPSNKNPHFSGRELEIARLISRGHTTRTVAAVLEISPWTVTTYVRRMFAKLDVASRSALVARCAALGLLETPETERQVK